MLKKALWTIPLMVALAFLACGCQKNGRSTVVFDTAFQPNLETFAGPSLPIEEPAGVSIGESAASLEVAPLDDFSFADPSKYRTVSLEECIYSALQSSPVIRELGGALLGAPDQVATIHDPALAYSNPLVGEEAALSEFDANWTSQFLYQSNDQGFNNQFIGDGGLLRQKLATYQSGISKLSATGGLFELNHSIEYDLNNSPSNQFGSPRSHSYSSFLEGSFRQPLFQGAGVDFNRIAGPNNAPGVNNGVLIARINTDITLTEFEVGLRDLVSDVENAYWDLYFAYRDLETRIEARDGAFQIWRHTEATVKDAAITNQAKEQYYRFAAIVENSIHGQLNEGTRTNNGSSGGTFRANAGVRTAERRLRLITGMQLNDIQLIVPKDMPAEVDVVFDWEQSKVDALLNRPELRRQRWQVKRRQLEYVAACNHLQPRVDLLGTYRVRGFGENLFGETGFDRTTTPPTLPNGSSATATFLDGDFQEWELGVDVNVPIGYRRQHAARRNAQLGVAREKSILNEQERQVVYGLSNAMGELKRAMSVRAANVSRLEAAKDQYDAIKITYEEEGRTIDQLLEAQRRVIDAKTDYYQSQVENMLALRSVHLEKGTLFRYHNVRMSESGWDAEAYEQASEKLAWKKKRINYSIPGLMVGRRNGAPVANSSAPWGEVIGDYASQKNDTKKISPFDEKPTPRELAAMIESSDSSLLAIEKMTAQNRVANAKQPAKALTSKAIASQNMDVASASQSPPVQQAAQTVIGSSVKLESPATNKLSQGVSATLRNAERPTNQSFVVAPSIQSLTVQRAVQPVIGSSVQLGDPVTRKLPQGVSATSSDTSNPTNSTANLQGYIQLFPMPCLRMPRPQPTSLPFRARLSKPVPPRVVVPLR